MPEFPRLGKKDLEDWQRNQQYLANLKQMLEIYAAKGYIPRNEARLILDEWIDYLSVQGWGPTRRFADIPEEAPFYAELVKKGPLGAGQFMYTQAESFKKEQEQITKTWAKRLSEAQTYLPQLQTLLSDAQKRGQITAEEADSTLKAESQLLEQGVPATDLLNYQNVRDYLRGKETAKSWEAKEKLLTGKQDIMAMEGVKELKRIEEISQFRSEQQAAAALGGAFKTKLTGWPLQMAKRRAFEELRKKELSQLPGEYNWIKRFMVEHAENPYEEYLTSYDYTPPPSGPETPEWLSRLTGLPAGKPLIEAPAPTPSLQQWGRLSPVQQERFAGYADWAGSEFADIIGRMEQMRPRTPPISPSWRASTQRTGR